MVAHAKIFLKDRKEHLIFFIFIFFVLLKVTRDLILVSFKDKLHFIPKIIRLFQRVLDRV
jgi:hypothetical protein